MLPDWGSEVVSRNSRRNGNKTDASSELMERRRKGLDSGKSGAGGDSGKLGSTVDGITNYVVEKPPAARAKAGAVVAAGAAASSSSSSKQVAPAVEGEEELVNYVVMKPPKPPKAPVSSEKTNEVVEKITGDKVKSLHYA